MHLNVRDMVSLLPLLELADQGLGDTSLNQMLSVALGNAAKLAGGNALREQEVANLMILDSRNADGMRAGECRPCVRALPRGSPPRLHGSRLCAPSLAA